MSCCGQKRNEYRQQVSSTSAQSYTPPKTWKDVRFEYTGTSSLTVKGAVTGKKYLFAQPGDILLVDYRDAGAMYGVSNLKSL